MQSPKISSLPLPLKFTIIVVIILITIKWSILQEPIIDNEIDIEKFENWSRKAEYDSILNNLEPRYEYWRKNGIEEPIAISYKFYIAALSAKGVQNIQDSIENWINILEKRRPLPTYVHFYYRHQADQNLRKGNWEIAQELLEKVIDSDETEKLYPILMAESLAMLAYMQSEYRNFDEALSNTEKADSLLKKNYGEDYAGRIMVLNNFGIIYGELGQLERALEFSLETRKLTQMHYVPEHKNHSISLNNLSVILSSLGRNEESLEALKEALEINIKQKRNVDIFMNYVNMASPYISKWDYNNALNYMKLAESMLSEEASELDPYRMNLYTTMIAFYYDLKDYDTAYSYLKKALNFGNKYYSDYSYPMANVYVSMGNLLVEKGEYYEAIEFHEKAIEIFSYYYGEESTKVATGYYWIGQIWEKLDSIPLAIAKLAEATSLYEKVNGSDHRYTIESRLILAKLYMKNNNLKEANRLLNNIFDQKRINLGKEARSELIPYDEMEHNVTLIEALELKIDLLNREIDKENKLKVLTDIARVYEYLGKEYDRILANYGGFKDRDDLRHDSEKLFKKAIAACYDLYELTGDQDWAVKAYTYSERARAMKIQEIMRDRIATNQSGLPDSVLREEFQLKAHLKSLENQLVETDQADSLVFKSLNKSYLMVNQEYNEFVRNLEKKYSKYYDLKYNVVLAEPEDIRRDLLNGRNTLIQYSLLDSVAYVHIIRSDDFKFLKLSVDSRLDEKVKMWYQGMKSRNFHSSDEYGKEIFDQFVLPIYSYIGDSDIIIVPDGALYYVNFESLPISHTGNDYMLEHHQIIYCYSPTVQIQSKRYNKRKRTEYDWVGFVPGFKADGVEVKKGFIEQPWAEKAAKAISARFKSRLFSGKNANITSFQEYASQGEILHMGTHAVADDEDPLKSYFVLSGGESQYDLLYANEIFNSEISSKCAVLTACETGVGKIKAGEGMVSLARAFTYAGCPNLILTLWPVDDEQTGALIESFYSNVADGMNLDKALHEAKKEYLKEARGELKHPYYWSGLLYYGSETNIKSKTPLKTILLYSLTGITILLLIGILIKRRRLSLK